MRLIALALFATLAFGCTGVPPTSPSALGTSVVTADSVVSSTRATLQKVTLYVYDLAINDPIGGNIHIMGLDVTVTANGKAYGPVPTNKQAAATFWIPAADTEIQVTTGNSGIDGGDPECFVPILDSDHLVLTLPLRARDGWILVLENTSKTPPDC
jgi:hypothetical protein